MREDGRASPSRHEAFSPRPLRHGPRTTSDIVAALREMNRRAHDRHRVETGRWEPRPGPEREGARLAFLAYKSRRTVVGRRLGTSDVGTRLTPSTRYANGPDSMKRGRLPGCERRPH